MVQVWSGWKRFPNAKSGDHVEAPIGPGVYEVRHAASGQLVAFGHAGNVANAIAELKINGAHSWTRLFRKAPVSPPAWELEYRTCAAASRAEAKTAAERMRSLRQSYWRRRMEGGWAARNPR